MKADKQVQGVTYSISGCQKDSVAILYSISGSQKDLWYFYGVLFQPVTPQILTDYYRGVAYDLIDY